MPAPTLDALPIEVLYGLCDELQASHPPSVAQLALVNRQCRRAAVSTLFRDIVLQVESPEKLAADVEQWTLFLRRNDSFRHVRALTVRGNIWQEWRKHAHKQTPDSSGKRLPPFTYEDSWEPLAGLVEQFPALKDIHFACESALPSCLLSVLHSSKLSACRLHIGHFRLGGLVRNSTEAESGPLELSPNEVALVTSPNLYAIKLSGSGLMSSGKADYHIEAILDLLASGNSSICEVEYYYRRLKDTPALRRSRGRAQYPGLVLPPRSEETLHTQRKLASLALSARLETVKQWFQRTNLDALRTLKLKDIVDANTLEWAAEHASFPSLSTLEINAGVGNIGPATATLLQSLPSLNELAILGDVDNATFSAISDHHGRSLRRLLIPRHSASIESLQMLNEACPCLEHLGIQIPRTQGDEHEVKLYQSLGLFSKLRTLCLDLDCSIAVSGDHTLENHLQWRNINEDPSLRKVCMRRVLVNGAIDATLVAAVFRQIAAGKSKTSSSLQSVDFNVVRVGIVCSGAAEFTAGEVPSLHPGFDSSKLDGVYRHFERQWKCTPSPRDDEPNGVIAEELKSSEARRQRWEVSADGRPPELGDAAAELSTLWPRAKTENWRNVWHSFPLAKA